MKRQLPPHRDHHPDDLLYAKGCHWVIHGRGLALSVCGAALITLSQLPGGETGALFGAFAATLFKIAGTSSLLAGLIALTASGLQGLNRKIIVTTTRVVLREGFFSRIEESHYLSAIHSIRIEQSVIGRLLNFGTIILETGEGPGRAWRHVPAPHRIQDEVAGHRDHEHG